MQRPGEEIARWNANCFKSPPPPEARLPDETYRSLGILRSRRARDRLPRALRLCGIDRTRPPARRSDHIFRKPDAPNYSFRAVIILTSLRANGSRECAPDDRLREAIQNTDKDRIALPPAAPGNDGGDVLITSPRRGGDSRWRL